MGLQEWPQAVVALKQGLSMASREELSAVGALKKLRTELEARRKLLEAQLLTEVKDRLYLPATLTSSKYAEVVGGADEPRGQP